MAAHFLIYKQPVPANQEEWGRHFNVWHLSQQPGEPHGLLYDGSAAIGLGPHKSLRLRSRKEHMHKDTGNEQGYRHHAAKTTNTMSSPLALDVPG